MYVQLLDFVPSGQRSDHKQLFGTLKTSPSIWGGC